jgi:hypothetical protein
VAERFHLELDRIKPAASRDASRRRLVGIRVERRAIAVSICTGEHLEFSQVRQLSSSPDKALGSAIAFITRLMDKFSFECAALERIPPRQEVQRAVLNRGIVAVLREHSKDIYEVSKKDLFEAFGYPALESRKELREIMSSIWPVLEGGYGAVFAQDAVALGLYCQVERIFDN